MRRNLRWTVVVLSSVTGLIGGMFSGKFAAGTHVSAQKVPNAQEVVAAKQFLLTDMDGHVRGEFSALETSRTPALMLYDYEGRMRAALELMPDGRPVLRLRRLRVL